MSLAISPPEPRRGQLLCPTCGSQRVVPVSVSCVSLIGQQGEVLVDQHGLRFDASAVPVEGGSAIAITCRCEHGHLFRLRLRTIYETTTAETVALPTMRNAGGTDRD